MRIAATPQAIACWEQARALDAGFPTVHRNLGLAYYNKLNEPPRALESFETAFAVEPGRRAGAVRA